MGKAYLEEKLVATSVILVMGKGAVHCHGGGVQPQVYGDVFILVVALDLSEVLEFAVNDGVVLRHFDDVVPQGAAVVHDLVNKAPQLREGLPELVPQWWSQGVVATPTRWGVLLMPASQAGRERQALFWNLVRQGHSASGACEAVGVNRRQGYRWIKAAGGRIPVVDGPRSGRYLDLDDRLAIADLRLAGAGVREIARELERAPSTISRELRRNSQDTTGAYRPHAAQKRCDLRARRPKPGKLQDPALVAAVERRLVKNWSPQQISDDLPRAFPDREDMHVSHETIYQSLFVQGRGQLRADLHHHLRTGRAARRPRGQHFTAKGRIRDKVMISERPAEAKDRAVAGHWEGDLIIGTASGAAIGTLVERSTRYVMLVHLPHGHSAENVRDGRFPSIRTLPTHLRRSLTWDQGTEMARHREVTLATEMAIYFCNPHSPRQRGSNENTNGLLRQYFRLV